MKRWDPVTLLTPEEERAAHWKEKQALRNARRTIASPAALYSPDEAAELTGYSPETILKYMDTGGLKAGIHYFMREWRYGSRPRKLRLLLPRGIQAIISGEAGSRHCRIIKSQKRARKALQSL